MGYLDIPAAVPVRAQDQDLALASWNGNANESGGRGKRVIFGAEPQPTLNGVNLHTDMHMHTLSTSKGAQRGREGPQVEGACAYA